MKHLLTFLLFCGLILSSVFGNSFLRVHSNYSSCPNRQLDCLEKMLTSHIWTEDFDASDQASRMERIWNFKAFHKMDHLMLTDQDFVDRASLYWELASYAHRLYLRIYDRDIDEEMEFEILQIPTGVLLVEVINGEKTMLKGSIKLPANKWEILHGQVKGHWKTQLSGSETYDIQLSDDGFAQLSHFEHKDHQYLGHWNLSECGAFIFLDLYRSKTDTMVYATKCLRIASDCGSVAGIEANLPEWSAVGDQPVAVRFMSKQTLTTRNTGHQIDRLTW